MADTERRRGIFDPEYLAIAAGVVVLLVTGIRGSLTEALADDDALRLVLGFLGAAFLLMAIVIAMVIGRIREVRRGRARVRDLWLDVLALVAGTPLLPLLVTTSTEFGAILLEVVELGVILVRAAVAARRIWGPSLTSVAVITALFAVGSGSLYPLVEEGTTVGDGIWWALVTVTTVGYGDVVPDSDAGRLLGTVLIVVGVALIAILTAGLAARLIRTEEQIIQVDVEEVRDELAAIVERLEAIERKLDGDPDRGPAEPEA